MSKVNKMLTFVCNSSDGDDNGNNDDMLTCLAQMGLSAVLKQKTRDNNKKRI